MRRTPNFEIGHFRASKTKDQEQLGTPAQIHFLSFSGLTNFFFFFSKKGNVPECRMHKVFKLGSASRNI